MEAKHEGTVSSVEISPDGIKVVCGTLNGSIGIIEKFEQRYTTLVRSHTDDILCIDYHPAQNSVISVSSDHTIRLWDSTNFD